MANLSLIALAANESTHVDEEAPSDLFVSLYSEVFLQTDTYEVYTRGGECITKEFVSKHYEKYLIGDFQSIQSDVKENGYILQYGEPECTQEQTLSRATVTMTAASEWKYVLEPLNELQENKTVEFNYRVIGKYETNGRKITSYDEPELELVMTFPGTLFTYETFPTLTTTLNSAKTEIIFDLSFTIMFTYPYCENLRQEIGPYYADAAGSAL